MQYARSSIKQDNTSINIIIFLSLQFYCLLNLCVIVILRVYIVQLYCYFTAK